MEAEADKSRFIVRRRSNLRFFLDAFLATWHLVFTRHGYLGPFRDFRCPVFAGLVHQEWCA